MTPESVMSIGRHAMEGTMMVAAPLLLVMLVAPGLSGLPDFDPISGSGLFILVQQFIIGAAMGFVVRMVFAAVEMAGELTGMTMGLGFATFFDPASQGRSSAISQFLALVV